MGRTIRKSQIGLRLASLGDISTPSLTFASSTEDARTKHDVLRSDQRFAFAVHVTIDLPAPDIMHASPLSSSHTTLHPEHTPPLTHRPSSLV